MRKEFWTDAQLAEWRASIPADWPEWRREFHEATRQQNCPTAREYRARLRREVSVLCVGAIRKAAIAPGWLTEKGQIRMREEIAIRRREHSRLAAHA